MKIFVVINCRFHGRKKGEKTKEGTQARAKVKSEGRVQIDRETQ